MPKINDSEVDEDTLPTRGRRAAPKSRFATVSAALLDPIVPLVARIAAWVSAHRLGALLTVAVIVAVTAIGSGAALMRTVSETAFSGDADTSTRENRPTPESTDSEGIGPQGPILPTSTPAPPFRIPEPTTAPSDAPVATVPDPEPTADPEPSATPEPTTDHPGNNGNGKGKPGGPNKPD